MEPHNQPHHTSDPLTPPDAAADRAARIARWKEITPAEVYTEQEFAGVKQAKGLYIVGVIGFSGQWSDDKLGSDPALRAKADEARAQLTNTLLGLKANHGDNLVVSSGATMEGVPKLVYEVCDSLGIDAMGVACEKAGKYELGKMKYFLPIGSEWGDESPAFLGTSDEILMIGGGGQAKREAIATATEGKPLTVFRGFGGSADDLSPDDVVGAKFVEGVN